MRSRTRSAPAGVCAPESGALACASAESLFYCREITYPVAQSGRYVVRVANNPGTDTGAYDLRAFVTGP